MKSWDNRPDEIAYLYNPGYIGRLLNGFIASYQSVKPNGVPYELIFVAAPLILLKSFQDSLPNSTRTYLHVWIQDNVDLKIDFVLTVKEIMPFVKESLIFLLHRDMLEINDLGQLVIGPKKLKKKQKKDSSEVLYSINKAQLVGRWFGKAGDVETIYALWGIKP